MADLIHGNTQLGATKQDLIASVVQRELAFQAKLVPTIMDVSPFAIKGAKSISIPKMNSFTVVDRDTGVQGDASVLVSTADQLLLDINAYVAWIVDSSDEVQSTLVWQSELAKRAAAAHGRYVDTNIIAQLETVGTATTTAGNISKAVVLEMRKALLDSHADLNSCTLAIGTGQEALLLAISEFVEADKYGSSNIPSGVIGRLFGVNVMVHTGLGANQYFMYEKSGCAVGFQLGAQMSEQGANEFGSGAKRVAMDQLFGVKGMQLSGGLSPLVIKDNN